MIPPCFVSVNPFLMVLPTIIFSGIAIYTIFQAFKGEKTAFFMILTFLLMTIIGIVVIPCWSFPISLIEMTLAFRLYKNKIVSLIVK